MVWLSEITCVAPLGLGKINHMTPKLAGILRTISIINGAGASLITLICVFVLFLNEMHIWAGKPFLTFFFFLN